MKRELTPVFVSIIVVLVIIASFLMFSVNTTIRAGEINLISLTQTPEAPQEGDNITITAEISGCSPASGIMPQIVHEPFFGFGFATPYSDMEHIEGNVYKVTFTGNNGTEIWYAIYYGNNVLAERTIQIGHVERGIISTLEITNVILEPEIPTSSTNSVTVTADIKSNVSIKNVDVNHNVFGKSSFSGGGGSGWKIDDDTYSFSISLTHGGGVVTDPQENMAYPAGSRVFYQIAAEDELGNTALYLGNFTMA
jgi:hypothetical protein